MEDRGSRKREFDLVVWGATGFTGKLVVAYLAKSAPTELTWAIAGRDQSKLENIIKDVGGSKKGIKFIVADVKDQKSMDELAKKNKGHYKYGRTIFSIGYSRCRSLYSKWHRLL